MPLSRSTSATNRSRRPIENWIAFFAYKQFFWHCSSCGQTRPQMAGKLFFSLIFLIAPVRSFCFISLMKAGISTPTGQPSTHFGFAQFSHRDASAMACSSV
jgi:hypothetical protein